MQEWQEKTRVSNFLLMSGCFLNPDAEDGPEKVKNEQLRNEASLNCASLRSRVHYVARRGLTRVEMNALRAPLTAISAPREDCRHFLLDRADAFIDGRKVGVPSLWRRLRLLQEHGMGVTRQVDMTRTSRTQSAKRKR